jgi:hypothetical protein
MATLRDFAPGHQFLGSLGSFAPGLPGTVSPNVTQVSPEFKARQAADEELVRQSEIQGMGEVAKNYHSGRIQDRANWLANEEALRAAAGDTAGAADARSRIAALQQEAALYAPKEPDVTQLGWDPGRIWNYAKGAVGSTAASMQDGLVSGAALRGAGAVLGVIPTPVTQGLSKVAAGLSYAVPFATNYLSNAGETYNEMARDPELMKNTTATQRLLSGAATGVAMGALDTFGDVNLVRRGLGGTFGKTADKLLDGGGILGRTAKDSLAEGVTELGQTGTQKMTLGLLNPNRDTSGDSADYWNALAQGTIGTTPLSGAANTVQALRETVQNRYGADADAEAGSKRGDEIDLRTGKTVSGADVSGEDLLKAAGVKGGKFSPEQQARRDLVDGVFDVSDDPDDLMTKTTERYSALLEELGRKSNDPKAAGLIEALLEVDPADPLANDHPAMKAAADYVRPYAGMSEEQLKKAVKNLGAKGRKLSEYVPADDLGGKTGADAAGIDTSKMSPADQKKFAARQTAMKQIEDNGKNAAALMESAYMGGEKRAPVNERKAFRFLGEQLAGMAHTKGDPTPGQIFTAERYGRILGSMLGDKAVSTLTTAGLAVGAEGTKLFSAMVDAASRSSFQMTKESAQQEKMSRDAAAEQMVSLIPKPTLTALTNKGVNLQGDDNQRQFMLDGLESFFQDGDGPFTEKKLTEMLGKETLGKLKELFDAPIVPNFESDTVDDRDTLVDRPMINDLDDGETASFEKEALNSALDKSAPERMVFTGSGDNSVPARGLFGKAIAPLREALKKGLGISKVDLPAIIGENGWGTVKDQIANAEDIVLPMTGGREMILPANTRVWRAAKYALDKFATGKEDEGHQPTHTVRMSTASEEMDADGVPQETRFDMMLGYLAKAGKISDSDVQNLNREARRVRATKIARDKVDAILTDKSTIPFRERAAKHLKKGDLEQILGQLSPEAQARVMAARTGSSETERLRTTLLALAKELKAETKARSESLSNLSGLMLDDGDVDAAVKSFFDQRFMLVGEQKTNRDMDKMSAGELTELVKGGKERYNAARNEVKDIGDADVRLEELLTILADEGTLVFEKDGKPQLVRASDLVNWSRNARFSSMKSDSTSRWDKASREGYLNHLSQGIAALLDTGVTKLKVYGYQFNEYGKKGDNIVMVVPIADAAADALTPNNLPASFPVFDKPIGKIEYGRNKRADDKVLADVLQRAIPGSFPAKDPFVTAEREESARQDRVAKAARKEWSDPHSSDRPVMTDEGFLLNIDDNEGTRRSEAEWDHAKKQNATLNAAKPEGLPDTAPFGVPGLPKPAAPTKGEDGKFQNPKNPERTINPEQAAAIAARGQEIDAKLAALHEQYVALGIADHPIARALAKLSFARELYSAIKAGKDAKDGKPATDIKRQPPTHRVGGGPRLDSTGQPTVVMGTKGLVTSEGSLQSRLTTLWEGVKAAQKEVFSQFNRNQIRAFERKLAEGDRLRAEGKKLQDERAELDKQSAIAVEAPVAPKVETKAEAPKAAEKTVGTYTNPIVGDLWAQDGVKVVSTNLGGVHGRGLAMQARDKGLIGPKHKDFDSSPLDRGVITVAVKGHAPETARVPGKPFSEQVAGKNIDLLKSELRKLIRHARANPDTKFFLPYVGLGFGEGDAKIIGPILEATAREPNIFLIAKDQKTVEQYAASFQPGVRQDATKPATKPVQTLAMKFKDGTVWAGVKHVMRGEFAGKSTMDLIKAGVRTATTRNTAPDLKVGDVVTMDDGQGGKVDVRITKAPYQLKWSTNQEKNQANAEKWSQLEGWAPEVFKTYAQKGAWQIQYELVDKPADRKLSTYEGTADQDTSTRDEVAKDLKRLERERNRILRKSGGSLWSALKGSMLAADITEAVGKTANGKVPAGHRTLMGKDGSGTDLSSLVADGMLDPWLPENNRSDNPDFDEVAAREHIIEALRGQDYLRTDTKRQLEQLDLSIQELDRVLNEKDVQDAIARTEAELAAAEASNTGQTTETAAQGTPGGTQGTAGREGKPQGLNQEGQDAAQSAESTVNRAAPSDADLERVRAHLTRMLGDKIKVVFEKVFDAQGEWIEADKTVKLAISSLMPMLSTANHEALHAFFSGILANNPAARDMLLGLVQDPRHLDRLEAILAKGKGGNKAAIASMRSSPEEALAYTFQFWAEGLIQVDKKPQGVLQKIQRFLREVFGMVRDSEKALDIFQALYDGKMAEPSAAQKALDGIMAQGERGKNALMKRDREAQWVRSMTMTANHMTRNSFSAVMRDIGAKLFTNPGSTKHGTAPGVLNRRDTETKRWMTEFQLIVNGLSKEDLASMAKHDNENKWADHPDPGLNRRLQALYALNHRFRNEYLLPAGIEMGMRDVQTNADGSETHRYMPMVWDIQELYGKKDQFFDMLKQEKYATTMGELLATMRQLKPDAEMDDVIGAIFQLLVDRNGVEEAGKLDAQREDGVLSPFFAAENMRKLDWIAQEDRGPFLGKDILYKMSAYLRQGVRAAEYVRTWGPGGQILKDLLVREGDVIGYDKDGPILAEEDGPYMKELRAAAVKEKVPEDKVEGWVQRRYDDETKAIGAQEGVLGKDISDNMRKLNSGLTSYQYARLLPFAIFASMLDPNNILVSGGRLDDMIYAYIRGMKGVWRTWKDLATGSEMMPETDRDALNTMAVGAIDNTMFLEDKGNVQASEYMTSFAHKFNTKFFLANGLTAWDRQMRIAATRAGMAFIERALRGDEKDSVRKLEALGMKADQAVLDKDGRLIVDPKVLAVQRAQKMAGEGWGKATKVQRQQWAQNQLQQAREDLRPQQDAVKRFVTRSVLSPNAAQRPAWGSDPHYQAVFALKSFTYSFQETVLMHAMEEAGAGNYRPGMQLLAGIPIMIAADITKALITGGGSLPGYMANWGVADWVMHGFARAGLGGIGEIGMHGLDDPSSLLGPSVDQVVDTIRDPGGRFGNLDMIPGLRILRPNLDVPEFVRSF